MIKVYETFEDWWREVGADMRQYPTDDPNAHARRVALAAWYEGMERAYTVVENATKEETK